MLSMVFLVLVSLYHGVDPRLAYSIAVTESNYNHTVVGDGGKSHGLFQIKCSTARDMNFKGKCSNLNNPYLNIIYGVSYLSSKLKKHSTWDAVSAYNAGKPFLCSKYPKKCKKSRKYVNNIYIAKVQSRFNNL